MVGRVFVAQINPMILGTGAPEIRSDELLRLYDDFFSPASSKDTVVLTHVVAT
jgi:hypothetical protein